MVCDAIGTVRHSQYVMQNYRLDLPTQVESDSNCSGAVEQKPEAVKQQ